MELENKNIEIKGKGIKVYVLSSIFIMIGVLIMIASFFVIKRIYNKYDEMNWGVILENTTLGDVINSLLTATRRTYFPGVHDIYFYASKVEAANDYLVFLVFGCLNYLFSITRNNNYVDIFASYKLGGE